MASISGGEGGSGSSRKKGLEVDLNLVPFIDLLSMCICFLLMTAVWVQIGSVQVKQSHGTDAAPSAKTQYDLHVQLTTPKSVAIEVTRGGRAVKKLAVEAKGDVTLNSKLDAAVAGIVKDLGGSAQTSGAQVFSSAMLKPKAGTSYGDLVGVMDVLRKHQIVNLGVVAARGEP